MIPDLCTGDIRLIRFSIFLAPKTLKRFLRMAASLKSVDRE